MTKLVVVGLDGAGFELLDPWIEDGKLPNIAKLRKEGVSADSRCCLPPVTSPNWKCYSTGTNPGKLGVFWWETVDVRNQKIGFPLSTSYRGKEIWDFLGQAGMRCAVINMPTTFPPKAINGCMIAGGPGSEQSNFTFPESLGTVLEERFNYRVGLEMSERDLVRDPVARQRVLQRIDSRFNTAKYLLQKENFDFLHLTIFFINSMHHFLWNDDSVLSCWQRIDQHLGDLIPLAENVMLMSDHGSHPIRRVFHFNTWLQKQGYLTTKNSAFITRRIGAGRERLERLVALTGQRDFLKKVIPRAWRAYLPQHDGTFSQEGKSRVINWEHSLAVASGQGPLYLTVDRDAKEFDEFRNKLIRELTAVVDQDSGECPFSAVFRSEECYSGKVTDLWPAIVVEQAPGWYISGKLGKVETFDNPSHWRAENKREGIFVAYGRDFQKSSSLSPVDIVDLAPTILHMFGLQIPAIMDGRILFEAFCSTSDAFRKRPEYDEQLIDSAHCEDDVPLSEKDELKMRKHLEALGYL